MTDAFPHDVTVDVLVMSILAPGRQQFFLQSRRAES